MSEFEDLLCALCVPQRSLRLNLPFNAENTENAEDAEETLQLKTPLTNGSWWKFHIRAGTKAGLEQSTNDVGGI